MVQLLDQSEILFSQNWQDMESKKLVTAQLLSSDLVKFFLAKKAFIERKKWYSEEAMGIENGHQANSSIFSLVGHFSCMRSDVIIKKEQIARYSCFSRTAPTSFWVHPSVVARQRVPASGSSLSDSRTADSFTVWCIPNEVLL